MVSLRDSSSWWRDSRVRMGVGGIADSGGASGCGSVVGVTWGCGSSSLGASCAGGFFLVLILTSKNVSQYDCGVCKFVRK